MSDRDPYRQAIHIPFAQTVPLPIDEQTGVPSEAGRRSPQSNQVPSALLTPQGRERFYFAPQKVLRESFESLLPRSSPHRTKAERDHGRWLDNVLRDLPARRTLFRSWLLQHQVRVETKTVPTRDIESDSRFVWTDVMRLIAKNAPCAPMNDILDVVQAEKRPMHALRRECAESTWAKEMLPWWANGAAVAGTVPMVQAVYCGLWAIEQHGLADAARCQDLDPAACFVWTAASLLEDDDLLSSALLRWPDLENRFEAGGDAPCPPHPVVAPLLMVMGSIRRAAETVGTQAAGLCDATRPGLTERVWGECAREAVDMTRRAGPVIASLRPLRLQLAVRSILGDVDALIDSARTSPAHARVPTLQQQRDALARVAQSLPESDDSAHVSVFKPWPDWLRHLEGLLDRCRRADQALIAERDEFLKRGGDPVANKDYFTQAIDRIGRLDQALKEGLAEFDERLKNPPNLPATPDATAADLPVDVAPDNPDAVEGLALASEIEHHLQQARVQIQEQQDKLQQAGLRIERLERDLVAERAATTTSLRTDAGVDSWLRALPAIRPREALSIATALRPGIRALPTAWASAEASGGFRHGRKLLALLLKLGADYLEALSSGKPDSQARTIFGVDTYKSGESDSVRACEACMRERTFMVDGVPVIMARHLAIGTSPDKKETLRVHFEILDGKIVIGHCGPHLVMPRKV